MAVLGPRGLTEGRYYEEPDGLTWLTMEAADVVTAIDEGRDPADVLIDTGYWPEDDGPFPDDLRTALVVAVHGTTDDPLVPEDQ